MITIICLVDCDPLRSVPKIPSLTNMALPGSD